MIRLLAGVAVGIALAGAASAQERLPQAVAGTWRITRVLPARSGIACWSPGRAQPLVGSLLEYSQHTMRWQGGSVPLHGITTRAVSSVDLAEEAPAGDGHAALTLGDLGIQARGVTEVNLQHDDADITGSTTEVPGDSVLVAAPGRLIVSACGVYFEARRVTPRAVATPPAQTSASTPGQPRASHSGT